MKRRIVFILLLLVAGAIVNVAVAWGASWYGCTTNVVEYWVGALGGECKVTRLSGWPICSHKSSTYITKHNEILSDGIPLDRSQAMARYVWADGIFGGDASEFKVIPMRPVWPGFAINTVFYAVILWPLFAAPFALRRRLRVKRGLCPKCAYDLRGRAPMSDVCPECGWGVARGTGGTPTP